MIRYVCKSRARVGFVGCFFWEDKRVHERFFEEEKIKETHRESNKSATYTDVIGWLRYFPGYVLLIMSRWLVMDSPSLIRLPWQTIPCPRIDIMMGSARLLPLILYGVCSEIGADATASPGETDSDVRPHQSLCALHGLINLIIL